MRSWLIWLSFLMLVVSLGWFWQLSHDLVIIRMESDVKPSVEMKPEGKKGG